LHRKIINHSGRRERRVYFVDAAIARERRCFLTEFAYAGIVASL
jgi:hypothetical protein